jgi:hypothetical protein
MSTHIPEYREESRPEDLIQTGGKETYWPVRIDGGIPIAAFNSERSAINFCLRLWAEESSE